MTTSGVINYFKSIRRFYIKENNLYLLDLYKNEPFLLIQSSDTFKIINCSGCGQSPKLGVATDQMIYLYNNGDIRSKLFENKIVNAKVSECEISILFENGNFIIYDCEFNQIYLLNNVTRLISQNIIEKDNKMYVIDEYHNWDLASGNKAIIELREMRTVFQDIISSVGHFYLTNKGSMIKFLANKEYKIVKGTSKIKSIFGDSDTLYQIRD